MPGTDAAVAIYWDFENAHACLVDEAGGENAYRNGKFKPQDAVLDIEPVAERTGQYDHELAVRADLGEHGAGPAAGSPAPLTAVARVEAQLKKRGLRLPADRRVLWAGPELICGAFAGGTLVEPNFDSLRLKTEAAAAGLGIALPEAEFNKLKWILWRGWAFQPLGHDQGIRLQIPDTERLRQRLVATLLRQLPDPAAEDPAVLAEAFFGPAPTAEQRSLVEMTLAALPAARDEPAGLDAGDEFAAAPPLGPDTVGGLDGLDSQLS